MSQHWDCSQKFRASGRGRGGGPVLTLPCATAPASTQPLPQREASASAEQPVGSSASRRDTGMAGGSSSCCLPWSRRDVSQGASPSLGELQKISEQF